LHFIFEAAARNQAFLASSAAGRAAASNLCEKEYPMKDQEHKDPKDMQKQRTSHGNGESAKDPMRNKSAHEQPDESGRKAPDQQHKHPGESERKAPDPQRQHHQTDQQRSYSGGNKPDQEPEKNERDRHDR
jgi:hypothetical protein